MDTADRTEAQRIVIAPQTGQAIPVLAGQLVQVRDLEGRQVGDLWAIDRTDPTRWLHTAHTRDRLERLFPRLGESFVDQVGNPILALVADSSKGVHDMLFPPCNAPLYETENLFDHPNCHDNFLAAVDAVGVNLPVVPDPVNLFQNSVPQPDGSLNVGVAASEPGDTVTFRALRHLWFVLTSCSVDNWPTNNMRCTPLEVIVHAEPGS
ncbi:DUF1989 domain-containing protein [Streptomyces sp. NBC_01506]|uniref:DUF1989 domain-containing protein n=1 Tax=Streptomyces sp. NBC_01506 TaxID=2903887 RepID=UPI00386A690C